MFRARGADGVPVAAKVLDRGTSADRILREVDTLAAIEHPGVPKVLEVVDLDGRPIMVTQWVDGRSLADLMAGGALSPDRAVSIFRELANVLDHVHAQGVVHRDLSPDNVIVGGGDHVSLIDFGISIGTESATITTDKITAGTPRYLAPEVLEGKTPNARSDQYSAAILAYEMLTGQWPYGDAGDNISTTMHHHLKSAVTPASEVNTWLGTGFDPVVERGLAKSPEQRFASISAMANELAQATPAQVAAPAQASAVARTARPPWLVAAGVSALVLLGVALVWFFLLRDGDKPTATEWQAGMAASLNCNLLESPDFEDGQPTDGYHGALSDQNDIATNGGVGQSAALRVGSQGDFGLYSELVPVQGGESYTFRAFVAPTADAAEAFLRITALDENLDLIVDQSGDTLGEVELQLVPGTAGHVSLTLSDTPPEARYLVPTLGKEGPDGYLLVDEQVLALSSDDCGGAAGL